MARPMKLTPVQQNELDQIKSVINITPDDLLEDVKESMRVALRNRRDTASIMLGYLDGVTYSTEDRKGSKGKATVRRGRPAKAQVQARTNASTSAHASAPRVKANAKAKAAKPGKRVRVLSKEARARIVEAQRKRWAKVRKEAKAKATAKANAKAAKKSGKVKEIAKAA